MTSLIELVKAVYAIYMEKMVPRAAAALSYYLTMTIFPLIICLYALFGQNYEVAMNLINYLEQFLTPSASELIRSFLLHVAGTGGRTGRCWWRRLRCWCCPLPRRCGCSRAP